MASANLSELDVQMILDSINDGIYVTDIDRRILFWNHAAEEITGWPSAEVQGHYCRENILCHVDKKDHYLCGCETCPLYRSISTGQKTQFPIIVYAHCKDGQTVPVQVNVSPLFDGEGNVIAAVQVFHDLTPQAADMDRAREIQSLMMHKSVPEGSVLDVNVHYAPMDIVGGDFYTFEALDDRHYLFMLADVMGHGIAAALYTMHLGSLWEGFGAFKSEPSQFMSRLSDRLYQLIRSDNSYATAVLGLIDMDRGRLSLVGAGNPGMFKYSSTGMISVLSCSGLPLGMVPGVVYQAEEYPFEPGDKLLAFTDGAIEISDRHGRELGLEGLMALLEDMHYPQASVPLEKIEESLMHYCGSVLMPDDMTLLEIVYKPS